MTQRHTSFGQQLTNVMADTDTLIRPLLDVLNIEDICTHNKGYRAYDANRFQHFIEQEKGRFIKVANLIQHDPHNVRTICDLGAFIPYFPLVLSSLGYDVTIVDTYTLYGPRFESTIRQIAEKKAIKVIDLNILDDDFTPLGHPDIVLLMAVVEHLNGSPHVLMQKIHKMMAPGGYLVFDVPNIAEFTKRIAVLQGQSPLGDYRTYFDSAYPYMGHNREMTVSEVRLLMDMSGFRIDNLLCYDYSVLPATTLKRRLLYLIKSLWPIQDKGQVITVKAIVD